ncbi:MAG TPA: isovaleryl-CoA dehydrogenase [Xanthobacteraceae bacterium]|jgi:putative acyl-CoA dehydrogenase
MTTVPRFDTDEVLNQSPIYENIDLFGSDLPLREAIGANGGGGDSAALSAFGRQWGTAEMFSLARRANENPPRLYTFHPKGFRRDVVEFHPAYHELMRASVAAGLHSSTWQSSGQRKPPPAEVARSARYYMAAQIESGHLCPITMTRAALAALAAAPSLLAEIARKVTSTTYDPTFRPWREKSGMTLGMGMTEKQGGTDVRANSTTATPAGEAYSITGHKWFLSAPMCDAFLVLAQAPGGLTCFFVPRFQPDGKINGLRLQRLKDKLGNRSNASSEVEFADAFALRVGDEGAGVRTIIQMVQLTRLDCALASSGFMRMAMAQAVHHCRHRSVFQRHLYDQPMMRAVLADLALEVEGAIALVMRLSRAFDHAASDPREAAYARLVTPAAKYWICKTAPGFIYEAMECLGGNGYVEESVLPRLYREAPVNAIWEGSGNVMCLDVLRALKRDPEAHELVRDLGRDAAQWMGEQAPSIELENEVENESVARLTVGKLATVAAGSALAVTAPRAIVDAFVRTRILAPHAALYGADRIDPRAAEALLQRALPEG